MIKHFTSLLLDQFHQFIVQQISSVFRSTFYKAMIQNFPAHGKIEPVIC